jgi:hypothetical protein
MLLINAYHDEIFPIRKVAKTYKYFGKIMKNMNFIILSKGGHILNDEKK